jgi:Bifunctional DNA primase/polymerase, N-terminal
MTSTLDAALDLIAKGFAVVPVPHRKKGPIIDEWQTLRITAETAPQYFNGAHQNIGVIQGIGGATGLDLDTPEAIAAAPYLLPKTAVFGHASKPASH